MTLTLSSCYSTFIYRSCVTLSSFVEYIWMYGVWHKIVHTHTTHGTWWNLGAGEGGEKVIQKYLIDYRSFDSVVILVLKTGFYFVMEEIKRTPNRAVVPTMSTRVPSFLGSRHFSNKPRGKPATTATGRENLSQVTSLCLSWWVLGQRYYGRLGHLIIALITKPRQSSFHHLLFHDYNSLKN